MLHTYIFRSSKGTGLYQVLVQDDRSMSCDCKGWTLRCKNGARTCKHVRLVEAGVAEQDASFVKATDGSGKIASIKPELVGAATSVRKFNFE